MGYAWNPYAVQPHEGSHLSPLLSPLPMTSAPPPPPPRPIHQQPPPPPLPPLPPHFDFTHDHASLVLDHPDPIMLVPWAPLPYMLYWGPEMLGVHPYFHDVPMFAADV
ncbi:hypothetical protein [Sporisorium scitamineum]|nr:hypothetical protein [Sporisorium scitamineum]